MELIGYFYKKQLPLLTNDNPTTNLEDINLYFDNRDIVELRDETVQPICAAVILTKDRHILVMKKSNHSAGNLSPEKNKSLLYLGGHLDINDLKYTNLDTFANGMMREVAEETNLEINHNQIRKPIICYSPLTEKSAKHIGIIFPVVLEKCVDISFSDGTCKFIHFTEIDKINNLEPWSKIILENILPSHNKSLI